MTFYMIGAEKTSQNLGKVGDGQDKHSHLRGQLVYHAALRLPDGVYRVELKLDDPTGSSAKPFKGQTLQTKIADVALSASRVSDVEPASDVATSAAQGIPHGILAADIPMNGNIVSAATPKVNGENAALFSNPDVRQSELPLGDARVPREDVDTPHLATTAEAFGDGDNPLVRGTRAARVASRF